MNVKKTVLCGFALVLLSASIVPEVVSAKPGEFEAIASHLKAKYHAKKVHIPFMFLARFAVNVVRPAGVKSFNVTLFTDLKFSKETLDVEMQQAMRQSFGADWTSVFHARSRDGQQAYMYMREDGKNVKLAVVTVENDQAALIRATFSPDKLSEFINNPRIFGISVSDDDGKDESKAPAPQATPKT